MLAIFVFLSLFKVLWGDVVKLFSYNDFIAFNVYGIHPMDTTLRQPSFLLTQSKSRQYNKNVQVKYNC